MYLVLLRAFAMAATVALAWLLGNAYSSLFAPGNVQKVALAMLGLWGVVFAIFVRLQDLAGTPGLSSRERERLVDLLPNIRNRTWYVGAMNTACAASLYFVTLDEAFTKAPWFPILVGALAGISMSYAVIVPVWHTEISNFVDRARKNEAARKARDEELGALNRLSSSQ